jgi:hypothetical protein
MTIREQDILSEALDLWLARGKEVNGNVGSARDYEGMWKCETRSLQSRLCGAGQIKGAK